MMSENLTREETRERSSNVAVQSARIGVDLQSARDLGEEHFKVTASYSFRSKTESTWIDFIGHQVERVNVNGVDQEILWDGARIRLTGLREKNEVHIEALASYSRTGEGLHRYQDPEDGAVYVYSHYEPADARRLMPCFEQPDLKSQYVFEVKVPRDWRVLSNAEVERIDDSEAGVKLVEFQKTLPLPSYITAIAAGPYHEVRESHAGLDFGILCRRSLAEYVDFKDIFAVTFAGMDLFQKIFDYPYPWGKYDQIFVPEYNIGAMENPGLITFNENYIKRGRASHTDKEALANTVLHEMAHMWFGNLVTMKWWDDLWLKESFADFCASFALASATRYSGAWVSFAIKRKAWAYEQDQLPTTHPIIADIYDLEAAKQNFDGITYAKGAAVIRQLVAFVGEDKFFQAVQNYFKKYEFLNTEFNDLLQELQSFTDKDVFTWAELWLKTSGVTSLTRDNKTVEQSFYRPQNIKVAAFNKRAGKLEQVSSAPLNLGEKKTELPLTGDLVLLNYEDLSYVKNPLTSTEVSICEDLLSCVEDDLSRALFWSALWNQTRDAELAASRFLKIVEKQAPLEMNPVILTQILVNALFAVENFSADKKKAAKSWLETSHRVLETHGLGVEPRLIWTRAFADASIASDAKSELVREIIFANDEELLRAEEVDKELKWQLLTGLIAHGLAGVEEAGLLLADDQTGKGMIAHAKALAARPDCLQETWQEIWFDESISNEKLTAMIAGFNASKADKQVFEEQYFERVKDAWKNRTIEMATRLVVGLYPAGVRATTWLEQNTDTQAALKRLIIERDDHQRRALVARAA